MQTSIPLWSLADVEMLNRLMTTRMALTVCAKNVGGQICAWTTDLIKSWSNHHKDTVTWTNLQEPSCAMQQRVICIRRRGDERKSMKDKKGGRYMSIVLPSKHDSAKSSLLSLSHILLPTNLRWHQQLAFCQPSIGWRQRQEARKREQKASESKELNPLWACLNG